MKKIKIKNSLNIILMYTLCFFIICAGVFWPFIKEHKSLIWAQDGLLQTFTSMVYIGDYYKSIIASVLQGNFNFQMIDFNIGLGYDVFTTLNYYGLGDPLLLLTVFFQKDNMYILYNILVILRLYLCGIGFIFYCIKMKKGSYATLIGALIYVFSGFSIAAGQRHPYFLNGMIYLPLLLIGLETILRKKKSYLFTIMIFISLVSNFYFFYMLTFIVFFYAFIRFVDIYRGEWKKNILSVVSRGVLQYMIGVLMASFAFLPTLYAFTNNARGTSKSYTDGLFYSFSYYVKFLYGFISPVIDVNGNFTFMAYAPISFFLIVYLFLYRENKKKHIALKCGYALATLMLFTPIAAYVMNGMSYPSNRFIFAYSFFTGIVVATILDDFLLMPAKRLYPMIGITAILFVGGILLRKYFSIIGISCLVVTAVVLVIITYSKNYYIKYAAILITTMIAVAIFGYYKNAPIGMNYVNQFTKRGTEITALENSPQISMKGQEDSTFYRVGSYGNEVENQSLILGYNGTASYYSLVNGNVINYLKDMEVTTLPQPHRFYGLDARTYLEALASVKYQAFWQGSNEETRIPYGYVKKSEENNTDLTKPINLYENQYTLPIGYTYDKKISKEYYNTINSVKKQQAMLQAIVTEEANDNDETDILYSDKLLNYQIDEQEGISWDRESGRLKVDNKKSSLTITFQAQKDCETYVRLEGLDIENAKENHFNAKAVSGDMISKLYLTNANYRWDVERKDYLINLGSKKEGETTCTITLGAEGEFKLKDIQVYSLPLIDYEKQIAKLRNEAMTSVKLDNNTITGEIEVIDNKTLCFGILYNKGWSLKVDGKEASLYKANIMYMATDITKGYHTIELNYQTPGIKLGAIISLITLLLVIVGEAYTRLVKVQG